MKKVLAIAMALAFTATAASAASVKCTVKAIDGNNVTMECKKASSLKAGDAVTVKAKKKKAIEGC
ncbi:MAG: hypothetical protein ABFR97_03785 [Thermodesulfobacteriota bacterium]